tara:strand:+ start:892 stop:1197 length:306 start_codon:yes stop_codon:yes gene_type:complete
LDLEREIVDLTHEIMSLDRTRDFVLDDQALDRIIKDLESKRAGVNERLKSVYADLRGMNASLQGMGIVGIDIPCHNRLAGVNDGAEAPLSPEDDGSDADVW